MTFPAAPVHDPYLQRSYDLIKAVHDRLDVIQRVANHLTPVEDLEEFRTEIEALYANLNVLVEASTLIAQSTPAGQALLTAVDAAAQRLLLELQSAALRPEEFFAAATALAATNDALAAALLRVTELENDPSFDLALAAIIADLEAGTYNAALALRLDAVEAGLDEVDGQVTALASRTDALELELDGVDTALAAEAAARDALSVRVTATEDGIAAVASDVVDLTTRVSDTEAGLAGQSDAIDTLVTQTAALDGELDTLASRTTDLESQVDSLQSEQSAQAGALDTLTTRVTAAEGEISSVADAVTDLDTRISDAEGDLLGQAGALATLSARTDSLEDGLTSQASSITTVRAQLSGTGNLVPNAALEVDVRDWDFFSHGTGWVASNLIHRMDPASFPPGVNTLGITASGIPADDAGIRSVRIPVKASGRYIVSAYLAAAGCTAELHWRQFNAAGTQVAAGVVGTVTNAGVADNLANCLRREAVVLGGSTACELEIQFWATDATATGPKAWLFRPMVEEAQPDQTTASPWVPSVAGLDAHYAAATTELSVEVAEHAGEIVTLRAQYVLTLDVDGYVTGWKFVNDGDTGIFDIRADMVKITAPAGYKSVQLADGILSSRSATHARFMGVEFGPGGMFIDWYGPMVPGDDHTDATAGAALFYLTKDGSPYFGGTLSTAKVTEQLAGSGVNILWDEYARLNSGTVPLVTKAASVSLSYDAAISAVSAGGSLKATVMDAAGSITGSYVYFGNSVSDYNLTLKAGRKYIVSAYLRSNNAGAKVQFGLKNSAGVTYLSADQVLGGPNIFIRQTLLIDTSANTVEDAELVLFLNRHGQTSPFIVYIDRIMVEEQRGNILASSPWQPGPAGRQALAAIASAATSLAAVDGSIKLTRSATAPAGPNTYGDIWVDSDDDSIWRYIDGAWVARPNDALALSMLAAMGAQAVADGKATTFYSATTPTATGVGDLWYNKNTLELKRWNGSIWALFGSAPIRAGSNLAPNASFLSNASQTPHNTKLATNDACGDGWICTRGEASYPTAYCVWLNTGVIRSFIGNDPVANGVTVAPQARTSQEIPVTAGTTYVISAPFTAAANVSNLTGITRQIRAVVQWLDSAGAVISSSTNFSLMASSGTVTGSIVAPATAKSAWIFLDALVTNGSGSTWTPNNTVTINVSFGQVTLYKKADVEVSGSTFKIGDQRNLPQSLTTNYGSVRTATAITATAAGAISINAHSVNYGATTVSYSAVASAITGKAVGSKWVIYCIDPDYAGGVQTWLAGTNEASVMALGDGVVVAGIITIPSSGSSSGGGGGSGLPGEYCVAADMVLPDGLLAGEVRSGTQLMVWDENADRPGHQHWPVQDVVLVDGVQCREVRTESGAVLIASDTTPVTLRDGRMVRLTDLEDEEVLVRSGDGSLYWDRVTHLLDAGLRQVAKIYVYQRSYFAGRRADLTICTHNPLKP